MALAAAGCGGDDDSDKPSAGATGPTETAQPPTGATGATGVTGVTGTTGTTRKRKKNRSRVGGGSDGAAGSPEPSPAPQRSNARRTTERNKKERDSVGFKGQERYSYNLARVFCRFNDAKYLAGYYKLDTTNPSRVAREYAKRAYEPSQREAAYAGCLKAYR